MTPSDCGQFLEVGQEVEDQYDLVDGTLVFLADMAAEDDHTCLVSALCALISRLWIAGRRVQPQAMPRVKLILAREAPGGASERIVMRECGV